MGTLLLNANCYEVQIVETICKTLVLMTVIIVIFLFFFQLSRIILEWKKCKLANDKETKLEKNKTPNPQEEARKLELQRQDRAKALVKDFYELTKDDVHKEDHDVTQELINKYKELLSLQSNNVNNENQS